MTTAVTTPPPAPPFDDAVIDRLLDREEDYQFDCKRIKKDLTKLVETVVAFANSEGGTLAIGFGDPDKAKGRDRVFGIQENPMNWDYRLPFDIAVTVHLFNEARPSTWEQVSAYLDRHGSISNTEVRQVMQTENVLAASKQIKKWVERGQLVVTNPHAAKRLRRYGKPVRITEPDLVATLKTP